MAKLLYFVLLAAVVWKAYADQDDEDQDFIPDSTQNNREIKCGKYYAQYPNPEDCGSYIVCQNGQKSIKSCPSGQHYNFKTIRCVEPCQAYCNKTLSCECKWPTCGLDDVCFLEQIVGGCRNRVTRYFFNKRTAQCERFGYSGCMGNENNFETLEECQQKCSKAKPIPGFRCLTMNGLFPNPDNCRTYFQCSGGKPQLMSCQSGLHYSDKSKTCEKPCDAYCDKSLSCECKWPTCGLDELCFLPPEVGPCRAGFYNYYFNRRTGQCEKFLYGGCQGNKNNFQKKEECEKACTKTKPIPKFECLEMNGLFTNPDNCGTYFQCSDFKPKLISCEAGLHFSDKSRRCEKPCDAFCEKSLSCDCKWPTCGLKDLCFLPAETGLCRALFHNYYFNRRTGQCEKFIYGGCLGNENNFRKKEECEKACSKSEESPVDESTEPPVDEFPDPPAGESTEPPVDEFPDPPAEEVLDPSFECGPDGFYPHPKNCRFFVKCSKGAPTLKTCPTKLHFNNKTKKCETPCKANCDRTYACQCKWPTCGTNALCFLPYKPGPCKGKFERFHFNKRSGECTTFEYGGCLGNENNFLTKHACERKCKHSLDICKLPYKTGPCKGKFERYYFNHKEGKCQNFTFGGCNGNHNNFKTLDECETTCLQNKYQETYPLLGCSQENSTWVNIDDCSSYYRCTGGNTQLVKCPSGQHYSVSLKRCTAPCDAYCEPSIACKCGWPTCTKSEDFTCVKDGLFRDPESCSSYIHCVNGQKYDMPCPTGYHFNEKNKLCETPSKAQCQVHNGAYSSAPSFCKLPSDKGPCKGSIPRWYYIPAQNRCWMFSWGGCRGNGNNFQLQRDCETTCKRKFQYSEDICRLPVETGPCKGSFPKYYFNHEEGKCKTFIYGGCEGNGNNFDSIEECERSCLRSAAYSEDICRLPDETGPCKGSFPKYYFNHEEGKCKKFIYGGCEGNGNKFDSIEECERSCLRSAAYSEDICRLPAETGPCKGSFPKYYFNHEEGKCKKFIYGGCKGNGNNFDSIEECERSCLRSAEDASSEPICAEDGVRPDFESCGRYIRCSNGQKQMVSCPPGLHFNEASKQCDSPCDARCDMSLAFRCGWPMGTALSGDNPCPENEHLSLTGAACQRNCKNYKDWIVPCPLIWRRGCICDEGYVRNSEGKCIPTDECETDNE